MDGPLRRPEDGEIRTFRFTWQQYLRSTAFSFFFPFALFLLSFCSIFQCSVFSLFHYAFVRKRNAVVGRARWGPREANAGPRCRAIR